VGTEGEEWILLLPSILMGRLVVFVTLFSSKRVLRLPSSLATLHGRPHRMGNVGVAIGVAGMPALLDFAGQSRSVRADFTGNRYWSWQTKSPLLLISSAGRGPKDVPSRWFVVKFCVSGWSASDLIRPKNFDLVQLRNILLQYCR